jgi:hypothetical protein
MGGRLPSESVAGISGIRTGMTKADIIQDHDQDIGGTHRRLDLFREIWLGILQRSSDFAF